MVQREDVGKEKINRELKKHRDRKKYKTKIKDCEIWRDKLEKVKIKDCESLEKVSRQTV